MFPFPLKLSVRYVVELKVNSCWIGRITRQFSQNDRLRNLFTRGTVSRHSARSDGLLFAALFSDLHLQHGYKRHLRLGSSTGKGRLGELKSGTFSEEDFEFSLLLSLKRVLPVNPLIAIL